MLAFWIAYIPFATIGLIAMVTLSIHLKGWIKEDNEWYKYEKAYQKWKSNNCEGEIPR